MSRIYDYTAFSGNSRKGGNSNDYSFGIDMKYVDIDIAVFTLPHMYRELFIDPNGILVDLIPNIDKHQHHFKYMEPFFGLHENYQLTKLSLLINVFYNFWRF